MEASPTNPLVLIAEDDPASLDVLCETLSREPVDLAIASDGQMALEMARSEPPDLILLDVQMPIFDGFEVCRRLKAEPEIQDIPVIFMTSLNALEQRVRGLGLGAVDYISKPFEESELRARVRTQLALRRMTRTLKEQNGRLEEQLLHIKALQANLEREKNELIKTNQELMRSREQTTEVFAAMSEMLPGQTLDGKYRVESKIGSGGFGAVYRAVQVPLDRPVALKVLRPHSDLDIKERISSLRDEGISASRVNHPNAVVIFDANTTSGVAYLTMELLEGHTLSAELGQTQRLSLRRCSQILIPVCEALAHAHSIGVVHCDIKPGNIFLHQSRTGEVVKVLDFGIAKLLKDSSEVVDLTKEGSSFTVLGTPAFIAPERWRREPYDGRVDVYSVGVMAVRMLTGYFPSEWGVSNADLPQEVATILKQALSRNPAKRPSMADFLEEWRRAVASRDSVSDSAVESPLAVSAEADGGTVPNTSPNRPSSK